ncbi:MAG: hypothetical protein P0Y56_05945 [Candidatus Andeanibacterium colombiense]|uniref:Uncharacterized protein n=1 Tax=Candidatus Andeanibacterium colombiense TaxID=3121345 RepID=A0AAJ5X886_9SPHN|nr:MAG: hypothetical protein P0Y56_05945 [Sphingomonadaceae bacterium]
MKFLYLIAAATAFAAAPAAAEVVHQSSVPHNGSALSANYEASTTTKLRQIGGGPRMATNCLWQSEVSVERKLSDASGQPVAALSRTVGTAKLAEGVHPAACATIGDSSGARFTGGADNVRSAALAAAESDRTALHAELASLGSLGRSSAH